MTLLRASEGTPVPVSFCAGPDRRIILWAAILASSMGFIDSSVTSIATPAMREALGATLQEAQWINAAYLLSLSSLVLVGGAMGDRFGIARIFSLGILVFVGGSLACAAALTPEQMIDVRKEVPPEFQQSVFVETPIGEGIVVVRAFMPDESWTKAIGEFLGGAACTLR